MSAHEKQSAIETDRLAQEQVRKKAYIAREQALENARKVTDGRRAEKRAAEEIEQQAKEQARKEALLAREQAIAEDQEARRGKAKKQP